jgi:hypothetical protein
MPSLKNKIGNFHFLVYFIPTLIIYPLLLLLFIFPGYLILIFFLCAAITSNKPLIPREQEILLNQEIESN